MDLSGYAELVVRLANAAAGDEEEADGDAGQNISTVDGLREFLADLDFGATRITRGDLDALQQLRAEFREIFAARAEGNDTDAVERLNALLIRHPVHPQICHHDDQPWHLHLTQGGSTADRYAAGAAMGLAIIFTQFGLDRLGACRAPSCTHVFIDTSSNKSRRYCSDRCASRANVTTLRARRRAGTPDVLPTAAV